MRKPSAITYMGAEEMAIGAVRRDLGKLLAEMERLVRRSERNEPIASRLRVKALELGSHVKTLEGLEARCRRAADLREPGALARILPFPKRTTPAA